MPVVVFQAVGIAFGVLAGAVASATLDRSHRSSGGRDIENPRMRGFSVADR